MFKYSASWLLLSLPLLSSCATTSVIQSPYLSYYREGCLQEAEDLENQSIDCQMPCGDFRESTNATLLLLDRATTRLALGETKEAIADYDKAIQAIDFYNQPSPSEQLMQTVTQDDAAAFAGDDYEQILARVYFALALLQQGDQSNAYAVLRQGEEAQQRRWQLYRDTPFTRHYALIQNPVAKYLFAILLEQRGDLSNARILYDQVRCHVGPHPALPDESTLSQRDKATVLIVCHNGNVPRRISVVADASVASGLALEFLLQCHDIPFAGSTLAGIQVPELIFDAEAMPQLITAQLDGCTLPVTLLYDVAAAAAFELEERRPVLVARGVVRLALRRALVGVAYEQDPLLGAASDLVMFAINASTRADTRSWRTLPWTLDLARFDVSPGSHTLTLPYQCPIPLTLQAGELCVVNVFNLHPGITVVRVPNRFQGESP